MIDIEALKGRIANGIYGDDRLTGAEVFDALAALDALVAEVERLRGQRHADNEAIAGAWDAGRDNERAAVVKWLRDEAARLRKAMFVGSRAYVLESTAYMIENGVHAEQQEKT